MDTFLSLFTSHKRKDKRKARWPFTHCQPNQFYCYSHNPSKVWDIEFLDSPRERTSSPEFNDHKANHCPATYNKDNTTAANAHMTSSKAQSHCANGLKENVHAASSKAQSHGASNHKENVHSASSKAYFDAFNDGKANYCKAIAKARASNNNNNEVSAEEVKPHQANVNVTNDDSSTANKTMTHESPVRENGGKSDAPKQCLVCSKLPNSPTVQLKCGHSIHGVCLILANCERDVMACPICGVADE